MAGKAFRRLIYILIYTNIYSVAHPRGGTGGPYPPPPLSESGSPLSGPVGAAQGAPPGCSGTLQASREHTKCLLSPIRRPGAPLGRLRDLGAPQGGSGGPTGQLRGPPLAVKAAPSGGQGGPSCSPGGPSGGSGGPSRGSGTWGPHRAA